MRTDIAQVAIEERLNARVRRAKPVAEQLVFLMVVAQQRPGDLQEFRIGRAAAGGLPERRELQVDIADQFQIAIRGGEWWQLRRASCSAPVGKCRDKHEVRGSLTRRGVKYSISLVHRSPSRLAAIKMEINC